MPDGFRHITAALQLSRHSYLVDVVAFALATRHGFASGSMMLGVNLFSIKRLLGHSSLDQLDTYAELCEAYLLGDARSLQLPMKRAAQKNLLFSL